MNLVKTSEKHNKALLSPISWLGLLTLCSSHAKALRSSDLCPANSAAHKY